MCDQLFLQEKVQEMTVFFVMQHVFLSTNNLSVLGPKNTLTLNVDLFMFSVCATFFEEIRWRNIFHFYV